MILSFLGGIGRSREGGQEGEREKKSCEVQDWLVGILNNS